MKSLSHSKFVLPGLLTFCLFARAVGAAGETGHWSVQAFGAKGDGSTDNTASIQKALDEAGKAGGQVLLPPGRYRVAGSLRIPPGVTLQGVSDAPVWSEPLKGSVILATGGRDKEDAPALFELGHSATVHGITVWYPEQKPEEIHPYPWSFHLRGHDNTVENVTLKRYAANQWYDVALRFDQVKGIFDVSVDDQTLLGGAEFPDPTAPLERISFRTGEFRTSPTLRDPKSPGEDFPHADQPVGEAAYYIDDVSVSE